MIDPARAPSPPAPGQRLFRTTIGARRRAALLFEAVALSCLFSALALARAQEGRASKRPSGENGIKRELWLIFSPECGDLGEDLKRVAALRRTDPSFEFRPCLLADDFGVFRKPPDVLVANLKEFRSLGVFREGLRLWDDEGMRVARGLGIERLPAWGFVTTDFRSGTRKAHLAYGHGADLKELIACP